MKQIDIIKSSSTPPQRIKNGYGSVPSYKTLATNACFLEPRNGEQIIVVHDEVQTIRKGMMIRIKPEYVNTDALQNHYLFGVYRHACHVVLHIEDGIGCLKARRNGTWVDMITPSTKHFFQEVRIVPIQKHDGTEASNPVVPTDEAVTVLAPIPAHRIPTVQLRLDTFDRMMGHAIDFMGESLSRSQNRADDLFEIASKLTDKALAKYAK